MGDALLAGTPLEALADASGRIEGTGLVLCSGAVRIGGVEVRGSEVSVLADDGRLVVEVGGARIEVRDGEPAALSGSLDRGEVVVTGASRRVVLAEELVVEQGRARVLSASRDSAFLREVLPRVVVDLDPTSLTLLRVYGAMLVSRGVVPPRVRFADEEAVRAFQDGLDTDEVDLGGVPLTLQRPAAEALRIALTGRDLRPPGRHAGERSFAASTLFWDRRIEAGLVHWTEAGELTAEQADRLRGLADWPRIQEIVAMEWRGLYFNERHTGSVLFEAAPPGTSQHHSLLAADLRGLDDEAVRSLESRGWFRTVLADRPHFTWLGVPASALPDVGLTQPEDWPGYWIPAL